jgi:hypothetical protein
MHSSFAAWSIVFFSRREARKQRRGAGIIKDVLHLLMLTAVFQEEAQKRASAAKAEALDFKEGTMTLSVGRRKAQHLNVSAAFH